MAFVGSPLTSVLRMRGPPAVRSGAAATLSWALCQRFRSSASARQPHRQRAVPAARSWRMHESSDRPSSTATATDAPAASAPAPAAYDFLAVERKWQELWEREQTFRTPDEVDTTRPKYYVLDMFPYPSAAGLHVGHPEGYTATDIVARYKRMRGFNVLHPMGWDAFGLPAEQYALETGTHPSVTTARNIARFRTQLRMLGFSFDWQREVNTTDPNYYRWTQWIFLQLYKRGLAYQDEVAVNWCPALGTVLANEEVIDGRSERGNHPVERRPMRQWVLRITEYAERLLADLNTLDWPENVIEMQRNWIGKSEGLNIKFPILSTVYKGRRLPDGTAVEDPLVVFTTRAETIGGATYVAIAPEHPMLPHLITKFMRPHVDAYVEAAMQRSDRERTAADAKQKTGVFTGSYVLNPATEEVIPIYVADYVLGGYGTGAVMGVPSCDDRDREFAREHAIPERRIVNEQRGTLIAWDCSWLGAKLTGVPLNRARSVIIERLIERGHAERRVNYKLRDWLFSRQRYWGEPFPIVYDARTGEPRAVDESELPVLLPDTDSIQPSGDGQSPLANIRDWAEVRDADTGEVRFRRETNTMPQWAGSCWYYLRFIENANTRALVDPAKERYWMPVDLYVGGVEHAVLHLLYARFWHKVLYDIGVVSTPEPFQRLVNQGMILGEMEFTVRRPTKQQQPREDAAGAAGSSTATATAAAAVGDGPARSGAATAAAATATDAAGAEPASSSNGHRAHREEYEEVRVPAEEVDKLPGDRYVLKADPSVEVTARSHKMSKSRGNVVNPDEVVGVYGADALRCFLMFMGPLDQVKPWSTQGVGGMRRFLDRVWRLVQDAPAEGMNAAAATAAVGPPTREQLRALHRMLRKVTDDTEAMRFNTAIAAMMEYVNAAYKWSEPWSRHALVEPLVRALSPYAPHMCEELWQRLMRGVRDGEGGQATAATIPSSLAYQAWPVADDQYLVQEQVSYAVQVNGKLRGTYEAPIDAPEAEVLQAARQLPLVSKHMQGKQVVREVFVPGKIVNFVVKQ